VELGKKAELEPAAVYLSEPIAADPDSAEFGAMVDATVSASPLEDYVEPSLAVPPLPDGPALPTVAELVKQAVAHADAGLAEEAADHLHVALELNPTTQTLTVEEADDEADKRAAEFLPLAAASLRSAEPGALEKCVALCDDGLALAPAEPKLKALRDAAAARRTRWPSA